MNRLHDEPTVLKRSSDELTDDETTRNRYYEMVLEATLHNVFWDPFATMRTAMSSVN